MNKNKLIPRSFIDELINRTDIVQFIDSHLPLKKRGTSFIANCPFHNEKTPSFNVMEKKQFYYCFGCGANGNVISFAMNYLNLGFVEAVKELASIVGLEVPYSHAPEEFKQVSELYSLLTKVTAFYQRNLQKCQGALDYLKKRNISQSVAEHFQLGYAPSSWHILQKFFARHTKDLITTGMLIQKDDASTYDRYRNRLMFPIKDRKGRIIGFGGRALDSRDEPKYLNSPETILFQKSKELYGLNHLIEFKNELSSIIVVEGYFDVISLFSHGIKNVVATLGTATGSHHVQLLAKYSRKIIFCFDGDNAGRKAALKALDNSLALLNEGVEIFFCFLPEGEDPDSFIQKNNNERFLRLIDGAPSLGQFLIENILDKIDIKTMPGKSQFINAIKPYLEKIGPGPYHELILDELASLTRIEPYRITHLLQENFITKQINLGIKRTPYRIALAILLQNPQIYLKCQNRINFKESINDKFIAKIMNIIEENPTVTTANLIEYWRNSPYFDTISKLAVWDPQIPDSAIDDEFSDHMFFIIKQTHEKKIENLLAKSRKEGLTDVEMRTLQNLLTKKHQSAN